MARRLRAAHAHTLRPPRPRAPATPRPHLQLLQLRPEAQVGADPGPRGVHGAEGLVEGEATPRHEPAAAHAGGAAHARHAVHQHSACARAGGDVWRGALGWLVGCGAGAALPRLDARRGRQCSARHCAGLRRARRGAVWRLLRARRCTHAPSRSRAPSMKAKMRGKCATRSSDEQSCGQEGAHAGAGLNSRACSPCGAACPCSSYLSVQQGVSCTRGWVGLWLRRVAQARSRARQHQAALRRERRDAGACVWHVPGSARCSRTGRARRCGRA
jgi:hypothetical protein